MPFCRPWLLEQTSGPRLYGRGLTVLLVTRKIALSMGSIASRSAKGPPHRSGEVTSVRMRMKMTGLTSAIVSQSSSQASGMSAGGATMTSHVWKSSR